jgi:hypothetical protein
MWSQLRRSRVNAWIILLAAFGGVPQVLGADEFERAPINYSTAPVNNAVSRLQKRLDSGKAELPFRDGQGFLSSAYGQKTEPTSYCQKSRPNCNRWLQLHLRLG